MSRVTVLGQANNECFPSLASLRVAHSALLKRYREQGNNSQLIFEIEAFILKGQATGVVLDNDDDRWSAQSVLDYWTSILYRGGHESPDATLAEFDPALAPSLEDTLCPYLGLEAFDETNQHLFFGRQALINQLIEKLKTNRLLSVIGSSGSGKSSVVLGGLLPKLKAGTLPDSDHWYCFPSMVPGSHPLANLAQLLSLASDDESDWHLRLITGLRKSPEYLALVINDLFNVPTVLVVDQFEEIFTLCSDDEERQAFVANLLELVYSPEQKHRVVLTMRTDFESQIVKLPNLKPLFESSQVRVTALDASELREAIEKPAELVGLKFEDGLIDELLNDVLGEPAALPLLQFTLLKLWDSRERNQVTWDAYRRLGGGRLALASSADEFYNALIPEDQIAAKRILLRMVRPSEGLEFTSSRIRRRELYQASEANDRIDRVLDRLIEARLLRQTEGETPEDDQVEVAHEALVRNWPRLVEWLDEERSNLRQRLRLTVAAEQWEAKNRDPSALLRGALLEEALNYEDFNELERNFVESSKRAQQRRRIRLAASFTGFIFLIGGLAYAARDTTSATLRAIRAEAAKSQAVASEREAMLLAEEARQRAEEAREQVKIAEREQSFALAALEKLEHERREVEVRLNESEKAIEIAEAQVAAAEQQQRKATEATREAEQRLEQGLSTANQQILAAQKLREQAELQITQAQNTLFSIARQRKLIQQEIELIREAVGIGNVIVDYPEEGLLWAIQLVGKSMTYLERVPTPIEAVLSDAVKRIETLEEGYRSSVPLVTVSPNSRTVISIDNVQETISIIDRIPILSRLLNLSHRGRTTFSLPALSVPITSITFSPNSALFALTSATDTVYLMDIQGNLVATLDGWHEGRVTSVSFRPDGQLIATASTDGSVRLWDLEGNPISSAIRGHEGAVTDVATSPDGRQLATASTDGTAKIWDLEGNLLLDLPLGNPVTHIAFSPDGRLVATAESNGEITFLNVVNNTQLQQFQNAGGAINTMEFTPDARGLFVEGGDGINRRYSLQGNLEEETVREDWRALLSIACQSIDAMSDLTTLRQKAKATCEEHATDPLAAQ